MSDATFRLEDLSEAVRRLGAAQVRGVPRAAMVVALYPRWQASALGEYTGEELLRGVDVWLSTLEDPRRASMPQPGEIVKALEDGRRVARREAEARNGGQIAPADQKRLGVFGGWVERCVGRVFERQEAQDAGNGLVVWEQREYREYRTFCASSRGTPIPERWQAEGYTVEIPVERGQTTDGAGRAWCRGKEYQPFAPGGHLFVDRRQHVSRFAVERARRTA
jgi:hypothetical protein